jgi:hypothetical protein
MAVDVERVLAQYDQQAASEPMHGQPGAVRRNPSADQKKARRAMQKKATGEAADNATIARLLRQASNPATPAAARAELIAEAERLQTARIASVDVDRALDLTVHEAVEIVPQGTHELHTSATDWLVGMSTTAASATEAEHALIAEASLWFERVPAIVKEDPDEYLTQAKGLAKRIASQYGEAADAAADAFMREAARLYRQGLKTGSVKVAELIPAHDLSGPPGSMGRIPDPTPQPGNQDDYTTNTHDTPKPGPHLDASIPGAGETLDNHEHPLSEREVAKHMTGEDVSGVREMASGYAAQQVHGSKTAARVAEDDELAAVLAGTKVGFLPLLLEGAEGAEGAAATETAAGEGAGGFNMGSTPGMPGGGQGGHGGSVSGELDSASSGVGQAADEYARQQVTSASQVPQVGSYGSGGTSGLPVDVFPSLGGNGAEPDTSSNRAPALQELVDFTGWNGTSVVPPNEGEAENENQGLIGPRDATAPGDPAGFPVSGSQHTASKGSSMTQSTASCPTCGGHGVVPTRKMAYSGLPQIDQIVNADDTPDANSVAPGQTEHYPDQVAWPLTGWGATPEQGPANIQNAIQQAEGQISDRNARSPLVTGTTAQRRQAGGRDNSGWIGDMGGRGTDYEGESSPVGYNGTSQLGQPDPVYGFGGEQGDRPLKPVGEMEVNDDTNVPPQVPFPGGEYDAGQAYRSVTPSMSTQGARDPFLGQIEDEMRRLQQVAAARVAQLQQRG